MLASAARVRSALHSSDSPHIFSQVNRKYSSSFMVMAPGVASIKGERLCNHWLQSAIDPSSRLGCRDAIRVPVPECEVQVAPDEPLGVWWEPSRNLF